MPRPQTHTFGSDLPLSPVKQCRRASASPSSAWSWITSFKFYFSIAALWMLQTHGFHPQSTQMGMGIAVCPSSPGQRHTGVLSAATGGTSNLFLQKELHVLYRAGFQALPSAAWLRDFDAPYHCCCTSGCQLWHWVIPGVLGWPGECTFPLSRAVLDTAFQILLISRWNLHYPILFEDVPELHHKP